MPIQDRLCTLTWTVLLNLQSVFFLPNSILGSNLSDQILFSNIGSFFLFYWHKEKYFSLALVVKIVLYLFISEQLRALSVNVTIYKYLEKSLQIVAIK